jgi:ElaB/YqjD/DUF883 family membrane-anchored ribosome-binding protein
MENRSMQGNTSNTDLATDAANSLGTRHEETLAQLSRTVSQAEDLLRALGDESGEAIDAMRNRVAATLRDARTRLNDRAQQARHLAHDTMSQADQFVHENPWRAVAIGASLGVLVAMLMSRHREFDSARGIAEYH